jgi:hypothetical protein
MIGVRLLLVLALLNLLILFGDALYNILGGFAPLLR